MNRAGERGKIWYGAVAFWVVVVALLAARVLLLDTAKLKSYMAGAVHEPSAPPSPPTLADAGSPRPTLR
ncbi:hypothetical protein [Bradyrhizobium sp. WD16]|uniref:hypothetical protein n=1 Tax=Bradyrhizobium sp. WD16 TaxID=1521768 RepID=UPI0020A46DC2|nr:hypothetical protein [Bradyrhizobium sp. WD16]UTD30039.1 hypothetical protein DB459_27165 [Bradyrhizobium sp. WD16]